MWMHVWLASLGEGSLRFVGEDARRRSGLLPSLAIDGAELRAVTGDAHKFERLYAASDRLAISRVACSIVGLGTDMTGQGASFTSRRPTPPSRNDAIGD
jgi:hypothetical protein